MKARRSFTRLLNAGALILILTFLFLTPTSFSEATKTHADGEAAPAGGDSSFAAPASSPALPAGQPVSGDRHVLAASYYSVAGNTSATLTLNNKGPEPKEVRLSLFSLGGERFDPHPLTVGANSHRVIDLGEYATAGTPFEEGSLQVTYHGKKLEMGVQVKLADAARSLIFDEQLVEPAYKFASSRLEGVWWLPSPRCDVRLVLSNTTGEPLAVSAVVDGFAPPPRRGPLDLTLSPHETRVLNVPRDFAGGRTLREAGGISVEHAGQPGALLARALIGEAATGYSAVVEFVDPRTAKSSELHGAGLRLGEAGGEPLQPVIVARNTGHTAAVLRGRVPYTAKDGGTGVVPLQESRLAPGETKTVSVAALGSGRLPDVAAAGLEFEHTGEPGSVVVSALSTSRDRNQVFRVPLTDPEGIPSGTGGYPWRVEGESSTFVYIKNVTDQAQEYKLQLDFPGGVYGLGLKTVEAGQTVALDVRALRDGQVPDAQGRVIPPDASAGQVHWSVRGERTKAFIGRAEQADIASAASSTYACYNCCPDSFFTGWVAPGSLSGFAGDTTQFIAFEQDMTCYGSPTDTYQAFANFTSLDPAACTSTGTGLATAQGPGQTTIRGSFGKVYFYSSNYESGQCDTTFAHFFANALCEVFDQQITFTNVSYNGASASFEAGLSRYTATLDLGQAADSQRICATSGDRQFSITINFTFPTGGSLHNRDSTTHIIRTGDNNQFDWVDWGFLSESSSLGTGSMFIKVFRKTANNPNKHVNFVIAGNNPPGTVGTFRGQGRVVLNCP